MSPQFFFQKDDMIEIKTPPLKTSNVRLLSSQTQFCPPISTKSSSTSPFFSESPIWSSKKNYVGQKLKYISNATKVIDGGIFLNIKNDTLADPACVFHYTIRQSNGVTWRSPEEKLPLENLS